ncbi:hypothetical protein SERLA73DRAFT_77530 [Serpula lacrymans var. lacrymans S7.3]|uniref:Uncharacterized protein n=2 Tax=Serpula lacrymans var. lacrymans TaxID=341189 RepID=F8QAK1_SERL3|nr:uncharacterized protein SERLADRAFT_442427 [Serpula lacrymans var. lacrymans S7.9]EGN94791.1 hypothetical protein SERLA73DRAFT_77530 [Serpula lacrymans var. lacrymans S7.3]EGO20289.1 hypothetical protein SERLADRAFT_442427 [Serpula lacrymans var. lacrymans S7.9]
MSKASRIPQPKAAAAAPSTSRTAGAGTSREAPMMQAEMDVDALHARLALLGAPPVSKEELGRLTKGAFGEALFFLAESVRGRSGVGVVRTKLDELLSDEVSRRRLSGDGMGAARMEMRKASSRLEGARREVEGLEVQLRQREAALCSDEKEVRRLEGVLVRERHVDLLLLALERKERARKERVEAMEGLLKEFRQRVQERSLQVNGSKRTAPVLTQQVIKQRLPSHKLMKTSHTKDALTRLHAHHIYLSNLASQGQGQDSNKLELRLRKAIARSENLVESDERVEALFQHVKASAHANARSKVHFSSDNVKATDPAEALASKNARQKLLQEVYDRSIALGFLCDHHLASLYTFSTHTSAALRAALQDEAPLTKGYISALSQHITDVAVNKPDTTSLRIQEECGVLGNVTQQYVLEVTEKKIRRVHDAETFLVGVQINKPHTSDEDSLLIGSFPALFLNKKAALSSRLPPANYTRDSRLAHDQASKLLARKSEKVEMGQAILKDIETIHREAKMICDAGLV